MKPALLLALLPLALPAAEPPNIVLIYADDLGWIDETLCEPDHTIVVWRELASRLNRGIQRPEHLR